MHDQLDSEPEQSNDGIRRVAKLIPWPTSVSEEARATLIELGTNNNPVGVLELPKDIQDFREHVAEHNSEMLNSTHYFGVSERPGVISNCEEIGGVTVYIASPSIVEPSRRDYVYLDIHGGGLVYMAGEACRRGGLREAERLEVKVVSVDFRVPPDHPYPAALDDCLAVYSALLNDYRPENIIIGGISGGGSLAGALTLRARDEGLPLPAALVLLTPEVDLTESGDTFHTIMGLDPVLPAKLTPLIEAYANGHDLTDPYLSPLFGDFTKGFPPTFLQSGTRDVFLSNTVRMHRALRNADIEAELHVWEAMPHGGFRGAPEDAEISKEMRSFVDRHWA